MFHSVLIFEGLNLSQLTQHFLMHADSAVQADLSRSPTSAGGVRGELNAV